MPRDKTESHEKIVVAAMHEFLEKGFEKASMKAIADAVGMTSAALYRHFDGKEAMFSALVKPAINAVDVWIAEHMKESTASLDTADFSQMWSFDGQSNDVRLILDVMYEQPQVFRLLLFRSAGTSYENWMHEMIEMSTDSMMEFLEYARNQGFKPQCVTRDEMHMLVTAYLSALISPLEHNYNKDEAVIFLETIVEFFTPGWQKITGLK